MKTSLKELSGSAINASHHLSPFHLTDEHFKITSGQLSRTWSLTEHGAITSAFQVGDHLVNCTPASAQVSECYYDGLLRLPLKRGGDGRPPIEYPSLQMHGDHAIESTRGMGIEANRPQLRFGWTEPRQGVTFIRSWEVFPGTDVIVSSAEISSESVPQLEFAQDETHPENVLDSLQFDLTGWMITAVSFQGRTDFQNELVQHRIFQIEANSDSIEVRGHLLFLEPPAENWGFFLLHESPPVDEKRRECLMDFRVSSRGVDVMGWGIAPHEILANRLRQSYSVAIGGYVGGEFERLKALQSYFKSRIPAQPTTVVANPWGDERCFETLNEAFILRELEACAELGVTHYQIDDGWQLGGGLMTIVQPNTAVTSSFWEIDPVKFPNRFTPLVERARELGVSLSLWFAPDGNRQYRTWQDERDLLVRMYRQYGIRLFKIDNIWIRTKEGEENLLSLLNGVIQETHGEVAFNLDMTNGRRLGPVIMLRFGNIFIENRYVRPSNIPIHSISYLPWRVLNNLWHLARYLPAERLQFEIPNIHRAPDPALADSGFANLASEYEDAYLVAITLMASPLVWCEPSSLPAHVRSQIKDTLALHHQIRDELTRSHILPIGEPPSGQGWTGFQAVNQDHPGHGLLLIFREKTKESQFDFKLWTVSLSNQLNLECLSHGEGSLRPMNPQCLTIQIPRCNDFRLYRYHPSVERAESARSTRQPTEAIINSCKSK